MSGLTTIIKFFALVEPWGSSFGQKISEERQMCKIHSFCAILTCLFIRFPELFFLLFFNKWSVFLPKTKAFFKIHLYPYHITIRLMAVLGTGNVFYQNNPILSRWKWLRISGFDLRFTDKGYAKKAQLYSRGSRVMFVIFYFLSFRRTTINVPICIFVLFELFTSPVTIQGN